MSNLGRLMSLRCCALAALVAVSLCGCESPSFKGFAGTAPVTALRPTQSGQLVTVKLGRTVTATLPPDEPGRRWRFSKRPDERILEPIGSELIGSGPRTRLRFVFKASGVGTTSFNLTRPAPGPGQNPEAFRLTVHVR